MVEILSRRKDICQYAIIESALVYPMKATAAMIAPTLSLSYPLIKKEWFAKLQFQSLHIQKKFYADYYRDSTAITRNDMTAFLKANASYILNEKIGECEAKVLILVGGRESAIMKKSAELLHKRIPNSKLEILPGYYHGELSLNHAEQYIQKIDALVSD